MIVVTMAPVIKKVYVIVTLVGAVMHATSKLVLMNAATTVAARKESAYAMLVGDWMIAVPTSVLTIVPEMVDAMKNHTSVFAMK
jgi:hypothetical protein